MHDGAPPRAHVRARHAHWMRMAAESGRPPSRMEADQLLMDAQPTGRCWTLSRAKIVQPMAAGRVTLRAAVRRAWRGDVRLPPPDLLAATAAVRPPSGDDLRQIVATAEFYF
ncbi:hypothetical protein F511_44151 [Dorcoceras hygrometricum]|uniref:Uncharacterized protein n=1 Tax=Dorcoceras hygrometricum TaxID=472368 RepID=A0A2Z7CT14_9LAMI|nr:hypothetical protein F511_44151 [Dorcoceras hygrometricum]